MQRKLPHKLDQHWHCSWLHTKEGPKHEPSPLGVPLPAHTMQYDPQPLHALCTAVVQIEELLNVALAMLHGSHSSTVRMWWQLLPHTDKTHECTLSSAKKGQAVEQIPQKASLPYRRPYIQARRQWLPDGPQTASSVLQCRSKQSCL